MTLTPDLLLSAYAQGAFPMGDPDRGGRVAFYAPDPRAVLPLDAFHVPQTLAKTVRRGPYRVAVDLGFEAVVRSCAAPAPGRETTWITDEIVAAYVALHRAGFAHSVECHDEAGFAHSVECYDDAGFAGGLYGVALGGAFFGESMVSLRRDASKVALVHLVERLRAGGFVLLDTQMTTPHLARFGAVEIPRADYERRLARALRVRADWGALDASSPDGAPVPAHESGGPGVPGP